MTINMTQQTNMILININNLNSTLSKHTKILKAVETVVMCKRNKPIVEMKGNAPHVFGLSKGMFRLGPEFFEADQKFQRVLEGDGRK